MPIVRIERRMGETYLNSDGPGRTDAPCGRKARVVTDRPPMRAGFVSGMALSFALALAVGCKQGDGERCERDSDCSSGKCSIQAVQSAEGGRSLPAETA